MPRLLYDVAIIGAGVIGLAMAREFAHRERALRIVVVEKAARIGTGISSRSSEVIHAGLYYPASYLKSTLCVRGRDLLYSYCAAQKIPHKKIGKLVVANTDEEHEFLHALAYRAELNGVTDLPWLGRKQLAAREPALQAKGAFFSPSTGIIDSVALLRSLEREVLDLGVTLALRAEVKHITRSTIGFDVQCDQPTENFVLQAKQVINCAGLHATALAHRIEGMPVSHIPEMVLAKGDYFYYRGKNPFTHLVYPVPWGQPTRSPEAQHQSLGIHATIDLGNQLRFGPDLEIVVAEHYGVNENKRAEFARAIRHYFPALEEDKLQPAMSGIRPRLVTGNRKTPDFLIQEERQHGLRGLVNLFGIESPGLTCCFAMAEHVAALSFTP